MTCTKCGSADEVGFYTIDGVCDERGNSVGVPLCVDCAEDATHDEAFPPGDNFSSIHDMGLDK